ncbi:BatD family protein [Pseudomonas resinovorans]|uniref:BatD family protein n=1 Tax=Metapseudomonas resinovorans TaxID=53412 RepID=A0ABT4Y2P1_METRE|nr:BatD family protein [Pseudomonas resinovorans]MDA8483113.1 BatD family protein [Pseudomonas resinovorans]
MTRLLCTLLLSLLTLAAQAAGFSANVDRTRLSEGETVELTLESSDPTLFGKPDLTPLDAAFEVLGTRQINQLSTLNGKNDRATRWIITLQPKQSGFVTIPALKLGDVHSAPITLQVAKAEKSEKSGSSNLAPVFIDASLDQESVYVQAQAILTLRIYHSVSLYDDSSLSPLQMDDARVEQLGDPRTYEKEINGVRHGVIEVRYAVFPQKSGVLNIPPQVFSATLVDPASETGYQPFGPRPGKLSRVNSPRIPLTVLPKPADYPADVPWLPARNLVLTESWSPDPGSVQTGDSLTRSLMLNVEGLSSAQIPPLPATQAQGLRRYPDQPQLGNKIDERGLIGSREEREALVPTTSGRLELPAVSITWWNTRDNRLERSEIAARTLEVAINPELEANPAQSAGTAVGNAVVLARIWPWQLACALLACTTLLGFGLWWRARRQPAILPTVQTGPSPRTLLDELRRACQSNDPHATRQALDNWARQQPETLADMAARFVPLSDAMDGLNGALYSEAGQHWQGEDLWKAIRALPAPQVEQQTTGEPSQLPPLYPR